LAHYGRLEVAFDVFEDALREENVMKENFDVVASVITHAAQDVCPPTDPSFILLFNLGLGIDSGVRWRCAQ
jgi:hypothetical protein